LIIPFSLLRSYRQSLRPGSANNRAAGRYLLPLGKTRKHLIMESATLSTKGQLVIPTRYRKALHLRPGDKVGFRLEGERLVLQREESPGATLVKKQGRTVLVAPVGAPAMTTETIKALLADFP
jgi:AbrB family looped-hinge helix DNA binding protein